MIPNYFSYSSIQSYQKCPAQFQFRYIDRIFKKDEGIEAFMGKRVHETIEYIHNQKQVGVDLSYDSIIQYYNSLWEDKMHDRIAIVNKQIFPINRDQNIPLWKKYTSYYLRTGEKCIAKYYLMNQPFEDNVYANEYELDFLIDNDTNYRIKGFIDRLDKDNDGNWIIHDYKTGKRPYNQKDADRDMQLGLYQIGLEDEKKDVKSVSLAWHFLQEKPENIMVYSKRDEKDLKVLAQKIKSVIDEIRLKIKNKEKFTAKKTMLCNWCYYWEECPAQDDPNPNVGL